MKQQRMRLKGIQSQFTDYPHTLKHTIIFPLKIFKKGPNVVKTILEQCTRRMNVREMNEQREARQAGLFLQKAK